MKIPYSRERTPPIPVLKARIFSPLKNEYAELTLHVDTGFDGGVLIPFDLYEELKLTLVEEPYPARGVFPSGLAIELYVAVTDVEINGLRLTAHVYSSPLILKKLAGREILNKLILTLNGPKEELELLIP